MLHTTNLRARLAAALSLLVLALAPACQWAPAPVPADPGLHARMRGRTPLTTVQTAATASPAAAFDADPDAGRIYASHCAHCHELIPPSTYRAEEWPRYVRTYAPRAGLFGSDRARVLRWLQVHAAR